MWLVGIVPLISPLVARFEIGARLYPRRSTQREGSGMADMAVSDLATFLLGSWQLDRETFDASRQGLTGAFRGRAAFTFDEHVSGLLRYVEHGTLRLGSHRGPAFRRLSFQVDGACARVAFDDGRYFHDLDLREGRWEVEHSCGDDLYTGRFDVDHAHRWRQQWTVRGPDKRQFIRTVLERPVTDPSAGQLAVNPEAGEGGLDWSTATRSGTT